MILNPETSVMNRANFDKIAYTTDVFSRQF